MLIAARIPRELAEFYSDAIKAKLSKGFNDEHWLVQCTNGLVIQVYRPSVKGPWPNRGRSIAPCLQAEPSATPLIVLERWVSDLKSNGAKVLDSPKLEIFGAESWLSDPEDNAFLLLVPGPQ